MSGNRTKNSSSKYLTLIILGVVWLGVAAIVWNTTDMNIAAALAAAGWPMTLLALLIGLMNPSKVLPMVFRASRKRVALVFGISTLVLQVGGEVLMPKRDSRNVANLGTDDFMVEDSLAWLSEEPSAAGIAFKPSAPEPPKEKAMEPGSYYVVTETQERLAPHEQAPVADTVYRGQQVKVFSITRDWARVSRYFQGKSVGMDGDVANWVPVASLSSVKPSAVIQPDIAEQSAYKIQGIPQAGEHGLTPRDVQILHAAARYYCESGKASKIEYGDKSTTREGMYYFNFGTNANYFFRPEDIPNLDNRIAALNPESNTPTLHVQ